VIRIDVLDRDGSITSKAFVLALAGINQAFVVCPAPQYPIDICLLGGAPLSLELAQGRLKSEITSALIIIPEGFAVTLEKGNQTTLTFQPGAGLVASAIVLGGVQNVATRIGGPIVAARLSTELVLTHGVEHEEVFYQERLAEAKASWEAPPIRVQIETTAPNEKLIFGAQLTKNGFKLSAPGITVMFVMISILGLTQSLAEDRMSGILHRMGMMPVSKAQFLSGKLLATFLVGWVQFALLAIFGELLEVGLGSAPLGTLVVASAYVLAITAMSLTLAVLVRTPSQASAIATVAWVVLVPLGGAWWPLILVPPWMRTLGHLSPVAWCLDALNALIFFQGGWLDVLLPTAVLVVFALIFFVFGVKALDYQSSSGDDHRWVPPHFGTRNLDVE
jgi:ABC-2 type transport system permease protein